MTCVAANLSWHYLPSVRTRRLYELRREQVGGPTEEAGGEGFNRYIRTIYDRTAAGTRVLFEEITKPYALARSNQWSPPTTIVLITGANSSISYAASKAIAPASPRFHVIMASRFIEKCNAASSAIQAAGIKGNIPSIQLDATDEPSIAAAAERVEIDHSRLDVLVNNAGIYIILKPRLKAQLESTSNTNVVGAAILAEAFTPLPVAQIIESVPASHSSSRLGSMTAVADSQGIEHGLDTRAYRISNAVLNVLMMRDWKMLGKGGVKGIFVCPGLVESNIRAVCSHLKVDIYI